MELVVNKCYGGFSLSNLAITRMAELNGKKAYFFERNGFDGPYKEVGPDTRAFLTSAFTIPNPNEFFADRKDWNEMTQEERIAESQRHESVSLDCRPEDRADPILIQVVRELGEKANGQCAKLEIIEIPDGVDWELNEYDGIEFVHEKHRSW